MKFLLILFALLLSQTVFAENSVTIINNTNLLCKGSDIVSGCIPLGKKCKPDFPAAGESFSVVKEDGNVELNVGQMEVIPLKSEGSEGAENMIDVTGRHSTVFADLTPGKTYMVIIIDKEYCHFDTCCYGLKDLSSQTIIQ